MGIENPGEKEAKDVVACSGPGGCIAYLAMEIDGTQFTGYPVSILSALSYASARSAAGILFLLTGGLARAARAREQRTGVHLGDGSPISTRENDPPTAALATPLRNPRPEPPREWFQH